MAFPYSQTTSRVGQVSRVGNVRAMFLRKMAGNIINFTSTHSLARNLATVEQVSGAKGATFKILGNARAKFHTSGELIQGDDGSNGEVYIDFDDYLYTTSFISELDSAMVEKFKYNSKQSVANGSELNRAMDSMFLRAIAKGSLITSLSKARSEIGSEHISADVNYTKPIAVDTEHTDRTEQLVKALVMARGDFTDVDPVAVLTPEAYGLLGEASGSMSMGTKELPFGKGGTNITVPTLTGMPIICSDLFPNSDETNDSRVIPSPNADNVEGSGREDRYRGDFQGMLGAVFSKEAVGMVIHNDVETTLDEEPFRCGYNITSKVLCGFGLLRPDRVTGIIARDSALFNSASSAGVHVRDLNQLRPSPIPTTTSAPSSAPEPVAKK